MLSQRSKNLKLKCKKHFEISNKIFLTLLLLSILGLILSFILFRISIKEIHTAHFEETLENNTRHELTDINIRINEIVNQLETTAKAINEYDDFEHPDIAKILSFSNESNWFHFTAIADAEGNGYDNAGNTFNIADREYFQTAMHGQVAFSEVIKSKIFAGEYVQIIAHPLRSTENEVRGIIFGVFDIKDIQTDVLIKKSESDSNLYIIDSLGNYIAQFRKNKLSFTKENFWVDLKKRSCSDKKIEQLKSDFNERKEGSFVYSHKGKSRYLCYMPIGPNKWQLIYSVPVDSLEEVLHSVYKLDTKSMILASICYAVLLLCVIWYFKQSNDKIRDAHQEAKRNMEFLRISIDHSKHIIFEYDQIHQQIQLKTNLRNQLFNQTVIPAVPESFISMNLINPDSTADLKHLFKTIETEAHCEADIHIGDDHDETWYRISLNNLYDEYNTIIDTVGVVEDVSELKKQEEEMRKKLQLQNTLISKALLYAKVDLNTDTLLELNGEEVQTSFHDFLHDKIMKGVSDEHVSYVKQALSLESLRTAYQQGKQSIEVQFLWKFHHSTRWVSCVVYRIHMDDTSKIILVVTDIDPQKRKELLLKEQAERDGLTGLYNAVTARLKINEILSLKCTPTEKHLFVLIDLDNFKLANDTFGHSYGDQVLIDVASILNCKFRSSDIISRLGGDEFIVFLCNIKSYEQVEGLIKELCSSLHKTYRHDGKEVTISASIGVALAPNDGNTFQELYKKSDIAQYQIKKGTKNGYRLYQQTEN